MNIVIRTLTAVAFCISPIFAQVPDTMWTKTFGGIDDDRGYAVDQTNDGGFIITGSALSFGAGNYNVGLLKTDLNGNLEWLKLFGGPDRDGGILYFPQD